MNDKSELQHDYEDIPVKVGKYLISQGFELASRSGRPDNSLTDKAAVGILSKKPNTKPKKGILDLFKRTPKRDFVGTIWFYNDPGGASNKRWFFEVYGHKHLDSLRKLAKKLESEFGVKISIDLVSDHAETEASKSENDR